MPDLAAKIYGMLGACHKQLGQHDTYDLTDRAGPSNYRGGDRILQRPQRELTTCELGME